MRTLAEWLAALVDGCGLNAASWRLVPALHLGTYAEDGHHDAAGVRQGAPGTLPFMFARRTGPRLPPLPSNGCRFGFVAQIHGVP